MTRTEGNREVEEPVEDPGSFRRCEVWSGGAGFPCFYGRGKAGAGGERGRRRGSEVAGSDVSAWELRERREWEEERRAEELGAEEELGARDGPPLFLPTPSFMASAEEE